MIWRIILFWLSGVTLAWADLPRHASSFSVNLPASISLHHDANGNLTNDGTRWLYYDAENRLTNVMVAGQWQTVFVYDGLSRRRIMTDYTWQSSAWAPTNTTRYICDGLLVLQERNSSNTPLVSYTRGWDLSATRTGAGGIGGLLARTDTNGTTYYHCDGNGNITALTDTNRNVVARYEYDAFGRLLGQWGPMAPTNTMRFSSMPSLGPTGLIGYPLRQYDPTLMRWLNRDPIGERGGINLYQFNRNNPLRWIDPHGLDPFGDAMADMDSSGDAGYGASGAAITQTLVDSAWEGYALAMAQIALQEGIGAALGAIGDALGLGVAADAAALETPKPVPAPKASPCPPPKPTIPVSRWGRPGLQPGDWVMNGPVSPYNYLMSGKYQPSWFPGGNIPASYSSGVTYNVPPESVQAPPGFIGAIKGALGQGIYNP